MNDIASIRKMRLGSGFGSAVGFEGATGAPLTAAESGTSEDFRFGGKTKV